MGVFAVLAAPMVAAQDDEDDYGDDGADEYGEDYGAYGEDGEDEEEHVVVLSVANFEEKVLKTKFALVEFYAPWCGHCKSLKPEYAAAATEIFEYDPSITIGKVDATVHEELAAEYGVEGYPTLKWFSNGVPTDYDGGRDSASISAWVQKKTGPPSVPAQTVAELAKLTKNNDVVVLGLFSEFKGAEYDSFYAVASDDKLSSVQFVHTTSTEVAAAQGLKGVPGAVVVRTFDGGNVVYDGELTEQEAFMKMVHKAKLPLIIPFSQENAEKIFDSGINNQVLVFGSTDDLEDGLKIARDVSAEFSGKVIFVSVNTDEKDTEEVLTFFGLEMKEGIQVMGFSVENEEGLKYLFTEHQFTKEALVKFTTALEAHELTPHYKSEPIPAKNTLPVTVVVGNTFEEIVLDEKKDVLLEVYAPWCGHCKQLAPVYKKLGKRFSAIDSVVIAKIDGSVNEHPALSSLIEAFPTILFYPAGVAEPIPLVEDRSLAGMTKFIKQHAVIPYELKKKDAAKDDDPKDEL